MNYDETGWMAEGLCAIDEDAQKLFMSPFLEPFSESDFYEDNLGREKLNKEELEERQRELQPILEEKRTEHELANKIYTARAKAICEECPVLDLCAQYAVEKQAEGIEFYGVMAGKTKEERGQIINAINNE